MIFITLGSQKFQFNRLLKAIDELVEQGKIKEEVFAQIGYSDYQPINYKYKQFLDRDEFAAMEGKADIVITHGGTGAIIGAVKKGKKVIAVPRLAKYGEHVDDHQLQLLKEFEDIAVSSLGTIAVILLVVLMSVVQIKPKLDDKFVNPSSYPVEAAKYIKENLDLSQIRLFNEYNYGSYLLFEGIPVFIDSRADLYAPEFNGVRGKDGKYEGKDIFGDYISTSNISKYYENTFKQYDITHVILYKNSKLNMLISRDDRYTQLYSDSKFVIYERENND